MNRYGVFGKQKKMAGIDAEKRIFGGGEGMCFTAQKNEHNRKEHVMPV